MRSARVYKKPRRTVVELTSLLDLLFVMIFVSLIQQKAPENVTEKTPSKPSPQVKVLPVQKPTPKVVKKYRVSATFSFHPTPGNPHLPKGSYQMQGSFDEKTRALKLGGVSWLNRPKGYDMVPLSGTIEETQTLFKGRIDFPGCKLFTLKRAEILLGSPISGKWEGVYDCSQGPTGLTLTID